MIRQLDDLVRENLEAVLTNRRIRVTKDTVDNLVWRLVPVIRKYMQESEPSPRRSLVDMDDDGAAWTFLTRQQSRVLWHASQGCEAQETADLMGLALDTVKTHRRAVLKRLCAKNTAHAVYIGMREGFFASEPDREKTQS